MNGIASEISAFKARKLDVERHTHHRVALALLAGIDLDADVLPEAMPALLARIARLIERERLKGLRRHWSYDLNRHIALKQALQGLRGPHVPGAATPYHAKRRPKTP